MKFSIPHLILSNLIDRVAGIVSDRSMPILTTVAWRTENGRISLLTSDLQIQLEGWADFETESVRFCVGARKLQEIARALPAKENVEFIFNEDHQVTILCGRVRFKLNTLDYDQFPIFEKFPDDPKRKPFIFEARSFKNLILPVLPAMAKGDVRYYLNGILLQAEKGTLRAVASNGHILAINEIPFIADDFKAILPRDGALKLKAELPENESLIDACLSGNTFRFDLPGLSLSSKLIEGQFPEFRKVLPNAYKIEMKIGKAALSSVIRRIVVCADSKFPAIVCKGNRKSVVFSSKNNELDKAEETFDLYQSIEAFETAYNAHYFQAALDALPGDSIIWKIDPREISVFSAEKNESLRWIITPIHL